MLVFTVGPRCSAKPSEIVDNSYQELLGISYPGQ